MSKEDLAELRIRDFGPYHIRIRNNAIDKDGDDNDPKAHYRCDLYSSHCSLAAFSLTARNSNFTDLRGMQFP